MYNKNVLGSYTHVELLYQLGWEAHDHRLGALRVYPIQLTIRDTDEVVLPMTQTVLSVGEVMGLLALVPKRMPRPLGIGDFLYSTAISEESSVDVYYKGPALREGSVVASNVYVRVVLSHTPVVGANPWECEVSVVLGPPTLPPPFLSGITDIMLLPDGNPWPHVTVSTNSIPYWRSASTVFAVLTPFYTLGALAPLFPYVLDVAEVGRLEYRLLSSVGRAKYLRSWYNSAERALQHEVPDAEIPYAINIALKAAESKRIVFHNSRHVCMDFG